MWWFKTLCLLVITLLINVCHGILIVGPKFIRAGQSYNLIVSNFETRTNEAQVRVKIEGTSDTGRKLLNLSKSARLQSFTNTAINFSLPDSLSAGSYKISIDGENGFKLHKEASLTLLSRSVTGLIQLNKPIFKPGDVVQFRAIVLDADLKPPAGVNTAHITVHDPNGNVIRKWASGKLHVGVFEAELQVATVPLFGDYQITVQIGPHQIAAKTFEVKEYVLSSFDVEIVPSSVPLEKHQRLDLTIFAQYYVGKPVRGVATISLYLEDDKLDQRLVVNVYGKASVQLQFRDYFNVHENSQNVRVNVTFTQAETNKTIYKEQEITVYKHQYRVELIKTQPEFRAGVPFHCAVRLLYQDGKLAQRTAARVTVEGVDKGHETVYTSDDEGMIKLTLQPERSSDMIDIIVTIDDVNLLYERIHRREAGKAFLQMELKSEPKVGKMLDLKITCNEEMPFFLYYVVAKGDIVASGFIQLKQVTAYTLQIAAIDRMVPRAKIVVATVVKNVLLYDFLEVDYKEFLNNFNIKIDTKQVKPGEQLQLNMKGRPGAYVALAAYDKSVLQFSTEHDIFWQDILDVFNGFHTHQRNEYDFFQSMGLFARTMEYINFEAASDRLQRAGYTLSNRRKSNKLISFRTNFLESWLWRTAEIGASGNTTLKETVPDTTTAWHLTGFSVDPEYGLGIIKQPIEFVTVQEFYIVEHLPYSIKRGEAVALQFIIFSNYRQGYNASVTLFNVDNQTEFIGQPAEDTSYTKTVSVSSSTGVTVSFPIKARKLGEMTIRVKASIKPATDTIESVIRVIPESLVKREMESRFFCHNSYTNQSFTISLDFDKKANQGDRRIEFILTPNILTSVMDNLESLLSVPTGCGEQNMMRLVPIVQVLDYMTSIGTVNQKLTNKATGLLKMGYQNQMRFRQPDGSFGLWEKSGGAVFLTAFVGKTLATAAKYITEIEPDMVMKAYDWLASRQHGTGRFDETGPIFHKDMQGGLRQGIALTSFVLISLLEHPKAATKHAAVVEKGIKYVTKSLDSIEDSYDLAIATYALMLKNNHTGERFLEKLIGMSTVQRNGTERFWHRNANGIETTAYALLSFVLAEKYVDGTSIMRWLVKQRYTPGSFPRTQDTFVGLKALTKLAEKISPARNDYSVQLWHSGRKKEFRINSQDVGNLEHAEDVDDSLEMQIHVAGIGFGLLQVAYEYGVDLQNFNNSFKLELEKTLSKSGERLQLEVCSSFIPILSDDRSNMVLVEVNFPSGYTVEREHITGTTKHNPIQKIEVRFGGTSVAIYYNNMGTERNCFTTIAFRRQKVALKRPAYVLVHDYYDPKLNAVKMYQVDDDGVCDVCDGYECPTACKY
ncbi:CD109 antigen-like [Anopheles funestus]|uniref:CD109 antigen-like n=1 Tax=Anopheles funestus TaxID=62324 RepID=UPI0020C68927|nr:CD109 antigen-like [Anopheles funestus]